MSVVIVIPARHASTRYPGKPLVPLTGEADLYPRLGRTMEWDTAAGDAVLRGAGGQVVRFDDHAPLGYGKAGFENPFFIAYAPGVLLHPLG